MRGFVIGNADDGVGMVTGFVGDRLTERGVELVELARERPDGWADLDDADVVVSLGSRWNVGRAETTSLVESEAALLRSAHERGTPVLGICFGAQVLAHALGGSVVRAIRPEIGWVTIDLGVDVASDTLPAGIDGPWMQWHHDVFTVPPGFTELASTATGPQLVRGGRSVGTQFHPEVTMAMLTAWATGGAAEYRAHAGDPDELLVVSAAHLARAQPAAHALVDWFLDLP